MKQAVHDIDAAAAEALDIEQLDHNAPNPHGRLCSSCGCPVEPFDKFCPACGTANEQVEIVAAEVIEAKEHFRCDNCGSEVATDPSQRSYVCPFCDSTYVVQYSPDVTHRQPPDFVVGFSMTREQAKQKFRQWIQSAAWFRPADLKHAAIDKLKGVYLPFWSFAMLAESDWNASIGEHWYRTESYWTTDSKGRRRRRTRRVRETEWWPLSGKHHRYYRGYLVSGSRGLSQEEAERIKPFQLAALKRYEPFYLAGWLCEEYSVARDEALAVCQQEFNRREQSNVAAFMPGDTHRSLRVATQFRHVNADLCLLPVYIVNYRYHDKLYRILINGQTGRLTGTKPLSWKRIAAAIAAAAAGIAIFIIIVFVLAALGSR